MENIAGFIKINNEEALHISIGGFSRLEEELIELIILYRSLRRFVITHQAT